MSPDDALSVRSKHAWLFWVVLLGYTVLRLALLPGEDASVAGFRHDSAYLSIVAQNLLAGRGYVNDAHWLVFLRPESLPMPYHNANPLYPTLIAAVSVLTGWGVVKSALAVSALASSLLFAALYALISRFVPSVPRRLLLAAGGAFFPPVFSHSFEASPDVLCAAFFVGATACLVRSERLGLTVLGGALFGLAWLTRSSAVLMVPAVGIYLLIVGGLRQTLVRGAILAVTAVAVASPWLIHTAQVWGDPLRSDSSYYLLEEYHGRALGGPDEQNLDERYWHSTTVPPSLGELLRREPMEVISFILHDLPPELRRILAEWSFSNYGLAALVAALTLFALCRLRPAMSPDHAERRVQQAAIAAAAVYSITAVLVFSLRGRSLEMRYLILISIMLGTLLMFGTLQALAGLRTGSMARRGLNMVIVALSASWWLGIVPYQNVKASQFLTQPDPARAEYLELARRVQSEFGDRGPVVVGCWPYTFTQATGVASLSIPQSDDAYLLGYMDQYHARYVFLTDKELEFWRPRWRDAGGLPSELERVGSLGTGHVFAREGSTMISVVTPAYNEGDGLRKLHERLAAAAATWNEDYEFIVVDDGSRDDTLAVAAEIAEKDPHWKVISLSRNFGHQAAVTAGLEHASGDLIAVIDADLQDPPEELHRFLEKCREGFDVVYAIRTKRKENFFKRMSYTLFYRLLAALANIEIPLDSGDFCVMNRRTLNTLNALPERSRFIRGLRSWIGFRHTGLPYERQARFVGEPKYTFRRLINLALDGIVNFSSKPLRLISLLGISIGLLAVIAAILFFIQYLANWEILGYNPRHAQGWTSLILTVLFLSSVQLFCLGIIGEYVGRLFEEIKQRPIYLVGGTINLDRQPTLPGPMNRPLSQGNLGPS